MDMKYVPFFRQLSKLSLFQNHRIVDVRHGQSFAAANFVEFLRVSLYGKPNRGRQEEIVIYR